MTTASSPADPNFPQVIGFDVPSPDLHKAGEPAILSVLLDTPPSPSWRVAFAQSAAEFRAQANLAEARVVGDHLLLVGALREPRRLMAEVKALVHRVARQAMQRRVTQGEPDSPAPPAPGGETAIVHHDPALQGDLEAVAHVPGLAALLESVTRATGMRFAAVARVTERRWTACAVYDGIDFGLRPGQDLVLETTICNEVRQHHQVVAFNSASTDPKFAQHPTPALYGFESYISVPIFRANGELFGTLCAIDPEPARLDPETLATLQMYAEMIGLQLDRQDKGP